MLRHLERIAEQRLRGGASERNDELRLDQPDLLFEPGVAGSHLGSVGFLVEPPLNQLLAHEFEVLDGIGDVNFPPIDLRRLQTFVQQPTRGTDERLPGPLLLVARLLADEQQAGVRWPFTEYGLGGVAPEIAAATRSGGLTELLECGARRDEVGG